MREFDFYIVPTPIGNLGDMSERAKEVLQNVDLIACEDMRVTQKLLNHFDIKTKCVSYHKFNEKERVQSFLEQLQSGKKIALVSDAGTPLFCDPGSILVEELRKNDVKITALPGANAVVTFLSQISRKDEDFCFVGFLPKTKIQIEKILTSKKSQEVVFYESPNRILNTLEIVKNVRGNVKVALGRELTKMFEEIVIDDCQNVIEYFEKNILKGEIVAMVFRDENASEAIDLDEKINALSTKGFKAKEISVILSELFGFNKNDVYKRIVENK
ncbi:MAG: 16S rRNA (cytidine(1402)-2'-O)-methyltransferase [Candidatus Gastranaerophilales bacterium]